MIHYLSPDQLNVSKVDQRQKDVKSTKRSGAPEQDFKNLLSQKLRETEIKFSSHASKRLAMRGIELTEKDLDTLKQAVNLAESKGSRDALVLHDKANFVVSVKNRTVITAFDDGNMKERVVTNIDSAVIARSM